MGAPANDGGAFSRTNLWYLGALTVACIVGGGLTFGLVKPSAVPPQRFATALINNGTIQGSVKFSQSVAGGATTIALNVVGIPPSSAYTRPCDQSHLRERALTSDNTPCLQLATAMRRRHSMGCISTRAATWATTAQMRSGTLTCLPSTTARPATLLSSATLVTLAITRRTRTA